MTGIDIFLIDTDRVLSSCLIEGSLMLMSDRYSYCLLDGVASPGLSSYCLDLCQLPGTGGPSYGEGLKGKRVVTPWNLY